MTPREKAEALFRLAKSTHSQHERAEALARARSIVSSYGLHVTVDGRVLDGEPKPLPAPTPASLSAMWDQYAPRARRFLTALIDTPERPVTKPTPASVTWDLRDAPKRRRR